MRIGIGKENDRQDFTLVENLADLPSVARTRQGYSRVSEDPSSIFIVASSPSRVTYTNR